MVQDPQLTLATVHFQTWLICDLWMQVGAMAPWGNVTMETCEKNHLVNCDVARNTTGIVCLVDMYSICILGRSLPCVVFQMMRLGVPIETSSTPPVNRLANGARTEPCRIAVDHFQNGAQLVKAGRERGGESCICAYVSLLRLLMTWTAILGCGTMGWGGMLLHPFLPCSLRSFEFM